MYSCETYIVWRAKQGIGHGRREVVKSKYKNEHFVNDINKTVRGTDRLRAALAPPGGRCRPNRSLPRVRMGWRKRREGGEKWVYILLPASRSAAAIGGASKRQKGLRLEREPRPNCIS